MFKRILVLSVALAALAGCGSEPAPPPIPTVTSLPPGGNVILDVGIVDGGGNPQGAYGLGIYLVDPTSGAMQGWAISRPLEQPDSGYTSWLHGISWSQARDKLLFGGVIGNKHALFVLGRDGQATDLSLWGDAVLQTGESEYYDYAWSPDGLRIAYNRHDNRGASDPKDDVYLQDAAGSTPLRISEGLHGRAPAWSPDGEHLAFSTFHYPSAIYRVSVDEAANGGKPRLLVGNFRGAYGPAWSPDGKSIAFLGSRFEDDPVNLWVMDAEGGGLRSVVPLPDKLNQDAGGLAAFAWAPDSQRFVVLSDHAGPCSHNAIEGGGSCASSLHLVNADGTGLARLGPHTQSRYTAWLQWLP